MQTVFEDRTAYPESGEAYDATRVRVSISSDFDVQPIAERVAEIVEQSLMTKGSTIFYGSGRWDGTTEHGATIECVRPAAGSAVMLRRMKDRVKAYLNDFAMTAFVTVEPVTAFEVY